MSMDLTLEKCGPLVVSQENFHRDRPRPIPISNNRCAAIMHPEKLVHRIKYHTAYGRQLRYFAVQNHNQ